MKIAVTGLSGLLGNYYKQLSKYKTQLIDLFNTHSYEKALLSVHLNLLNINTIYSTLEATKPDVILHFAGSTHIDTCQRENNNKRGVVWKLNVNATQEIVRYCNKHDVHLIFISTENIFSGETSGHHEDSIPKPISWYGITKKAAEDLISSTLFNYTIIRAVTAYDYANEKTILGNLYKKIQLRLPIKIVTDHYLTPSYIPDIVKVIDITVKEKVTGILHVASPRIFTPQSIAMLIGEECAIPVDTYIQKVTLVDYFGEDASKLRTRYACLKSELTQQRIGIKFTDPIQALEEMKMKV